MNAKQLNGSISYETTDAASPDVNIQKMLKDTSVTVDKITAME